MNRRVMLQCSAAALSAFPLGRSAAPSASIYPANTDLGDEIIRDVDSLVEFRFDRIEHPLLCGMRDDGTYIRCNTHQQTIENMKATKYWQFAEEILADDKQACVTFHGIRLTDDLMNAVGPCLSPRDKLEWLGMHTFVEFQKSDESSPRIIENNGWVATQESFCGYDSAVRRHRRRV